MIFAERLYAIYYKLPDFSRLGIAGRVIDKMLAYVVKRILDRYLPSHFERTLDDYVLHRSDSRTHKIICSMTSFPGRIEQVWVALECLFRQTVTPDKILLTLSSEQFPLKQLPKSLERLRRKGLEVVFCEGDMKAHKKYLYAIETYPQDYVITFDDDLYYDVFAIENLLTLKAKFNNNIVTNRAHLMKLAYGDNEIRPYRKWQHNTTYSSPSHRVVATGGCGTLYERRLLLEDFSNTELIKKYSFHADDIWLKIMALKKGTKVVTNGRYGKDPIVIGRTQKEKLVTTNVLSGGNDKQLQNLLTHYNIPSMAFLDSL